MKKTLLVSVCVLALSCSAFAVSWGFGVRGMAMGGTGIATANDITAAYYNPAGLQFGPENFETQIIAGGQTGGLSDLISAASDKDFLSNNFDTDLDLSATGNFGLGISVRKVGVSLLAEGTGIFYHPASSTTTGGVIAQMIAMVPITLGTKFSTPILPVADVAVGINLKPIQIMGGGLELTGGGNATQYDGVGSGFGVDIGAQAKLTPLISIGANIRNLSASYSTKAKSQGGTINSSGDFTPVGAETSSTTTTTIAPEVGVGAGIIVPITGTLIACDIENFSIPGDKSYTDTHIGVEQGMLFNMVMLRAGYFTYGPTSDTYYTYGLGVNAGPASLGIAAANSQKDMNDSVAMMQLGMAF